MIFTNVEQRPKRCEFTSQQVHDMIEGVLTTGRIRQICRGYRTDEPHIGWCQFRVCVPDDGEFQFPFPAGHQYSPEDVDRVEEFIENARKTDRRYTLKEDRWYSWNDIMQLIKRSKRLTGMYRRGELPKIKPPAGPGRPRKKKVAA